MQECIKSGLWSSQYLNIWFYRNPPCIAIEYPRGWLANWILNSHSLSVDIKIRNVKQSTADNAINLYVPLAFSNALKVIREDSENKYIVENNGDFLDETGIAKSYKYNDAFLRPYMVSQCAYDFAFGAEGTQTPFRSAFLILTGS